MPLFAPDGQPQGYYVPPAIADRHTQTMIPVLTPERQATVARAVNTPDATFEMGHFLDELSREDRG